MYASLLLATVYFDQMESIMRAPSLPVVGIIFFLTLLSAVNLRLSQDLVSALLGRTGRNSCAAFVPETTNTAVQNGEDSTFTDAAADSRNGT
jgi:hypothetical protein